MRYWLFKSEPREFGIADFPAALNYTVTWDGIRNYKARNYLRDQIMVGDYGFFYHSSCPQPGIVGTVIVTRSAYPDPTAWCATSKYYDPKSSTTHPKWFAIDLQLRSKFTNCITLKSIKQDPELANMTILTTESRLSVIPISHEAWQKILALAVT